MCDGCREERGSQNASFYRFSHSRTTTYLREQYECLQARCKQEGILHSISRLHVSFQASKGFQVKILQ